jgi:Protein of unknown function (DUF1257)
MSHFTTIKTKIFEEDLLLKTLDNLKLSWSRKEIIKNQFTNKQYFCDIIIKQRNNQKIGFLKKNNSYKLIYDEMFWDLPIPVSLFNQKINTYYTLNLVNKNLSENGFQIKNLIKEEVNSNIKIKINALRFN